MNSALLLYGVLILGGVLPSCGVLLSCSVLSSRGMFCLAIGNVSVRFEGVKLKPFKFEL